MQSGLTPISASWALNRQPTVQETRWQTTTPSLSADCGRQRTSCAPTPTEGLRILDPRPRPDLPASSPTAVRRGRGRPRGQEHRAAARSARPTTRPAASCTCPRTPASPTCCSCRRARTSARRSTTPWRPSRMRTTTSRSCCRRPTTASTTPRSPRCCGSVNSIPDDIEGDVFGKIYEYFLGKFAMTEGQKGGEFFTPTSIVRLIVEIIEPFNGQDLRPRLRIGRHVRAERALRRATPQRSRQRRLSIYGQERVERDRPSSAR